ncbi:MAG: hypothetical protein CL840_14600 [Crocinitomicaceae bacterium]|nr:hypothetical protein [Crocinitomicaceae bacterium]|tara:strand:- start:1998 stop:2531 length:534 start_codon:yes stop_codon:yes gene_type:complete
MDVYSKVGLIFIGILSGLLMSCSALKKDYSTSLKLIELDQYNFSYQEPMYWTKNQSDQYNALVINYKKEVSAFKEFSILIRPRGHQDVHQEIVKTALKKSIQSFTQELGDTISDQFGAKAYILYGKNDPGNGNVNYITAIVSYSNGYEFRVILSNYYSPVEENAELVQIVKGIRIEE